MKRLPTDVREFFKARLLETMTAEQRTARAKKARKAAAAARRTKVQETKGD